MESQGYQREDTLYFMSMQKPTRKDMMVVCYRKDLKESKEKMGK